jgi:hypothetical protein
MGNLTNQYISASFDGLLQIESNNQVTDGLGAQPSSFVLTNVTASNLSVTTNVTSDLVPATNNNNDLGSTTKAWANIYGTNVSGTFTGDGSGLTGVVASAAPAGPTTSVQFKDGGSTSGSSDFTFNKATGGVTATSFSGSFSGSFVGDGSGLTNVSASSVAFNDITGTPALLSGSAQISSDISGSFTEVSGALSTRITTLENTTNYSGSFSGSFEGDGSGLTNVIAEWDGTHVGTGKISGSLIVSGSITDQVLIQTDTTASTVVPRTTSTYDLGTEALKWRNAWFDGHISASSGQFGALIASGSSVVISGSIILPSGSNISFDKINDKQIVFASGSDLESVSQLSWDYTTNIGRVTGSWIVSGSSTLHSIGKFISNGTTEVSGTLSATGSSWDLTNVSIVSMSIVSASTYYGDGGFLTNITADNVTWANVTGKPTVLSGSAQIANDISGSFVEPSSSFSTRVTDLESTSGSFSTRITDVESTSGSFESRITNNTININSLTAATSSYVTTGSNLFTGTQTIYDGNLIVSGSESVVSFIDVVAISGSVFSGSFVGDGSGLTGVTSLWNGNLNGNATITGSLTVSSSNVDFTDATSVTGDNFNVSGSFSGSFQGDGSGLTGVTAEWDGSHFGNASITGSLTVISDTVDFTGATGVSGSFSGSFVGDGSGLTNILAGAGGNNKSIQFNDGGAVSGSTSLEYEKSTDVVRVTNVFEVSGSTNLSGSTTLQGTTTIKGGDENAGIYITDVSAGSKLNPLGTGNSAVFINVAGSTVGALVNNSVVIGGNRTGETLLRDNTVYLPNVEGTNFSGSFSGSYEGDGSKLTGDTTQNATPFSASYALTASVALALAGGLQEVTDQGATTTNAVNLQGGVTSSLLQLGNLGNREIPFSSNTNGDISNDTDFTYNDSTQTLTVNNLNIPNNTTIGSSNADTVGFNADVETNFIPDGDDARQIGEPSNRWKVYGVNSSISGSFSGSFVGDGSNLNNIVSVSSSYSVTASYAQNFDGGSF